MNTSFKSIGKVILECVLAHSVPINQLYRYALRLFRYKFVCNLVLKAGLHDEWKKSEMKLFCPKCCDLYAPPTEYEIAPRT